MQSYPSHGFRPPVVPTQNADDPAMRAEITEEAQVGGCQVRARAMGPCDLLQTRICCQCRYADNAWPPACMQIAAAAMSVGPHRAIRHPDLQLFWWRHMEGAEEVAWTAVWPALSAFLARATRLSDRAGDVQAIQEMLNVSTLP